MQNLLDSVGAIHHKYQKLEKQEGFNIFSVLRSHSDEVRVHSRFIAELVNPKGSHGQGTLFLNLFLNALELTHLSYIKAEVQKEHKNIDILIRLDSKAIIIENKIWASDRKHQLQKYYEAMREEGYGDEDIIVIYLTLSGRGSTAYNRGSLEKTSIQLLSYKSDILQWLKACLRDTKELPILHQTIQQYEDIIRQLTGNTMRDSERAEVMELLRTDDNILKAAKIVEAWEEVRIKAEWNFWKELKALIQKAERYPILPAREVNHELVRKQVTGKKKGSASYGIMFQLATSGPDKICLYIQRGKHDLYYGITALDEKGNREISGTPTYLPLAHSIRHLNDKQEQRWIGKKYFSKPINFSLFRNETTLRLIQPDFRRGYVNALWEEIKAYIKACEPEISGYNTGTALA